MPTKTPSPTNATESKIGFTESESRLIAIAFKHMKNTPEIDWDAVAAEYPYKDAHSARSRFRIAMTKHSKLVSGEVKKNAAKATTHTIGKNESDGTTEIKSTAESKAKAAPRKRKAEDVDGDEETEAAPAKRGRKPAIKKADGKAKATPAKGGRKPKVSSTEMVKDEDGKKAHDKEDSPAPVDATKQASGKTMLQEANEEIEKEAIKDAGKEAGEEAGEETGKEVGEGSGKGAGDEVADEAGDQSGEKLDEEA